MLEIGSTDFLLKVPSLPEKELEFYSSKLFDKWEDSLEQWLSLKDYSISLEIEEGSISGKAKILATAGAIYMGVANYGGFISGIQTIRSQISYVSNILIESAKQPFDCSKKEVKVSNRGGALSQLQHLFHKVQNGSLTADQAMLHAMRMFGEEGMNVPGFVDTLKMEFNFAPRYPVQLNLIEDEINECETDIGHSTKISPNRKTPAPAPLPEPYSQQFRIEIWRESKNGRKLMKISKR